MFTYSHLNTPINQSIRARVIAQLSHTGVLFIPCKLSFIYNRGNLTRKHMLIVLFKNNQYDYFFLLHIYTL